MNDAQIKQRLQSIVEQVVALLPPEQQQTALQKVYVAGGAIVSLVLDETVHDYDLWAEDSETAMRFKMLSTGKEPLPGTEILANTENGITFKLRGGEVVQVVTRFVGPPSRVFESFDYTHCKCFFTPEYFLGAVQETYPSQLVMQRSMIEQKQLRYDGKKDQFALNTLKRYGKFCSRGWVPDNDTVTTLYKTIQRSPSIDDPSEHARQTIGFYGSSFT